MASATTKSRNYNGFERFLFVLTPILFTAALAGMLLILFNSDLRNKALAIGQTVPVLKSVLPNPAAPSPAASSDAQITMSNAKQKVDQLKTLLAAREATLKKATAQTVVQKTTISDLKTQLSQLSKDKQQRTITQAEYDARIKSLAVVYAKMAPGNAAPILESMTLDESALVLGGMTDAERSRVLQKMTTQKAADVSIKLKNSVSAANLEIAALQARVKELETKAGSGASTLDAVQLKQTFSTMKPSAAATLLLQMAGGNQPKALLILSTMADAARSQVLAAMSIQNAKTTATLVAKLTPV